MAKEAVFTMKLEPELRDAFMAAAKRADRPASQLMRELMRDFVESHEEPDEAYWEFVRRKVERSRRDVAAGRTYSNEEVEAYFAAKRANWGKGGGSD
jgi:predicted transcriptional regulator